MSSNRYPGARFDSESYSYIFSFLKRCLRLDEWNWTEHYAPQTETLGRIQFLIEKFDLKQDMQFNTRVKSAQFQSPSNSWLLTDESGTQYSSRYLITAIGILDQLTLSAITGINNYQGQAWHTARWLGDHSSLAGKRVGIIGTGATAIQTSQEIYKDAGSLTVFQRTQSWTAPLRDTKISPAQMVEIRARYPEIFRQCLESYSVSYMLAISGSLPIYSKKKLFAHWEELYKLPGFSKVLGVSTDIVTDREANQLYSEFNANKIRQRINDPIVAEKLIPKNYGFGRRRVPLESGHHRRPD